MIRLFLLKVIAGIPVSFEIGSFIAALVALVGMVIYGRRKARLATPAGQAAVKGHELQIIVDKLEESCNPIASCSYVAIKNGEAIPKFDAILKYEMIKSSDQELMKLFGREPQRLDRRLHELYAHCWLHGEAILNVDELVIPQQRSWAQTNNLGQIGMYYVKTDKGVRTTCLFANFKKDAEIDHETRKSIYLAIEEIKELPKKKIGN